MDKILITGVAGFVGSNLARVLLERGYSVIGIDDLSQGTEKNLESVARHPKFNFQKGDVCDALFMDSLGREVGTIAHLAAFKIPRYGGASKTLLINTRGTENVLEAARKYKVRVLFSSTSDVYGKNLENPFHEKSNCVIGPTTVGRWAYAVSKIYDEHLCLAYHHEFEVPVTIVRYFGGYGPHQHLSWWGGPQSVFIQQAILNKALPIHGDGNQIRSFTYISDLVEGTVAAIEDEKAIGEVFNIGNSEEISILELGKMIWRMIRDDDPRIEFIPYANFSRNYEDVQRRRPETSKAHKILKFVAKVSLSEGLRPTIEWQKKMISKL